jgi:RimJ/RimL family protein N-acetyltransferase
LTDGLPPSRIGEFSRKLVLPEGFAPPRRLVHEDVVATVLGREDLDDDVRGINGSLDLIRRTRGGDWPEEPVTTDFNFVDLVWHECEFREGFSYSYVLRDAGGRYLGCAYLYPMGRRTELTDELVHHDVDVSWWVTADAYEAGYYARAYAGLRRWVADEFGLTDPYWSNRELPG